MKKREKLGKMPKIIEIQNFDKFEIQNFDYINFDRFRRKIDKKSKSMNCPSCSSDMEYKGYRIAEPWPEDHDGEMYIREAYKCNKCDKKYEYWPRTFEEKPDLLAGILQKYEVIGIEEVYDAEDTWEHNNPLESVNVEALSVEEALKKGDKLLEEQITEKRKNWSSGWFVASVTEIYDSRGKLVYKDSTEHQKEVLNDSKRT